VSLPEKLEHPLGIAERAKEYADLALLIAHRSQKRELAVDVRLARIEVQLGIVPPPPRTPSPSSPEIVEEPTTSPGISSNRARAIAVRELEIQDGRRAIARHDERRRFWLTVSGSVLAGCILGAVGWMGHALITRPQVIYAPSPAALARP
jgi:hypothetical protein